MGEKVYVTALSKAKVIQFHRCVRSRARRTPSTEESKYKVKAAKRSAKIGSRKRKAYVPAQCKTEVHPCLRSVKSPVTIAGDHPPRHRPRRFHRVRRSHQPRRFHRVRRSNRPRRSNRRNGRKTRPTT